EVASPYFGNVVLHRVEILMVAVRSNVPHRGLARAAARVASDITVRIQPAPSAEELILLLDRLREGGGIGRLQSRNNARLGPCKSRDDAVLSETELHVIHQRAGERRRQLSHNALRRLAPG